MSGYAMDKVTGTARSNWSFDAVNVHLPTAGEFCIDHPPIAQAAKTKRKAGYWGGGEADAVLPLLCRCFFHARGTCWPVQKGQRTQQFPKAELAACRSLPTASRMGFQVSSPKFIGRAGGFRCSGLRGGWQRLDSLGNSAEQP